MASLFRSSRAVHQLFGRTKLFFIFLLIGWACPATVFAAAGDLDPTFNPGTGANSNVEAIALQSNGKIIIGGFFTLYDGTGRSRIARVKTGGPLDPTFDPGTGLSSGDVRTNALQSNGNLIIGGNFTSFNGTPRNRIARLNTNGTLDTAFDPGMGASGIVSTTAVQKSDGRIIVGGEFTSFNGTSRNRIARLNTNGSLDAAFDPGTGANGNVVTTALLSLNKTLIGGDFTFYNGTSRNRIARLKKDGTLDATFNPGTGANATVEAIAVQPADGKIIIGGNFTSYNGTPRNRIARLNTNGTLDTTFDPGMGANLDVKAIAVQKADGKIIIGGTLTSYNGVTRNRIARVNTDGSLDMTFNPGAGPSGIVQAIALQPADGKIIIGGQFSTYKGVSRSRIARVEP